MTEIRIRCAQIEDAETLPAIERSAGEAFRQIPELAWVADGDDLSVERYRQLIELGASWVAAEEEGGVPGAFLSAEIVGGELHIWEFAVRRDLQKTGVGTKLLRHVMDEAGLRGLSAITLTTFRDVPWNEPFYARLGFKTLTDEEAGPRLGAVLRADTKRGLPVQLRCAMRFAIRTPA